MLLLTLIEQVYVLARTGKCSLPEGFSPAMPLKFRPGNWWRDAFPIVGLTTWKDGQQYVAFRGTMTFPEWLLDFAPLPLIHVHAGFSQIYKAIQDFPVDKDAIITGHSLGAALASICYVIDGGGQLMTFGGPRVGNARFAEALQGTVRVVNGFDIVPEVPLHIDFCHGGCAVELVPDESQNIFDAHSLENYKKGVCLHAPITLATVG